MAAAGPVKGEAAARSVAAMAALRGQVTPKDIQKLVRKHRRRAKAGKIAKALALVGLVGGGAFAAWKWWDKQANPDWLVEPPAATEVPAAGGLTSVDGTGDTSALDPEVQAKEDEETSNHEDRG